MAILHPTGKTLRRQGTSQRQPATTARRQREGDASEYIRHLRRLLKESIDRVLLWCRVSGREQDRQGNLDNQEAHLRTWAARYGVIVIEPCWREVSSGWLHDDRVRFHAALDHARELGVPLVAETTDRFIRSRNYHTQKNPHALPSWEEFEELARMAKGVTMATVLIPDAPAELVRWFQQQRGKEAKGNWGGRPRKRKPGDLKRRREDLWPEVFKLHEFGFSLRDINRITGVPRMTLSNWLG